MGISSRSTPLPRVTIQYCTQCKWMLRAAYFAQELLSTFSLSLGEVALQPSTGGTFVVHLFTTSSAAGSFASGQDENQDSGSREVEGEGADEVRVQKHLIWDRKAEGGFPETKMLKRLIRDIIEPSRDLGHIDSHGTTASSKPPPIDHSTASALDTSTPIPSIHTALRDRLSKGLGRGAEGGGGGRGSDSERNFTPMEIDTSVPGSRNVSGAQGEDSEETGTITEGERDARRNISETSVLSTASDAQEDQDDGENQDEVDESRSEGGGGGGNVMACADGQCE